MKTPHAYVLKIEKFGRFTTKPNIITAYENGAVKPLIRLEDPGAETIRYTTDGSEPDLNSALYSKPFSIEKTSLIRARAYLAGALPSAIAEEKVRTYEWKNAIGKPRASQGIAYRYFQPDKNITMSGAFQSAPASSGVTDIMTVDKKLRKDKFAFEFTGYIRIDRDDVYTFFTQSDDGSKLFIDDEEIVNNDGDHGVEERSGKAALRKGFHKIKVLYFDSGGGNELHVLMQPGAGTKTALSASVLFH